MVYTAARYRRALKKKLHCCGDTRKTLLEKFDHSLNSFLEEHPTVTQPDLINAFGPPEEMANILMEGVCPQEQTRYDKRKLFFGITIGILVVVLLLFTMYVCFVKEIPMETNDVIFEGTIPYIEEVSK